MHAQAPSGRGLSLWWLPPPPLARQLQGLIDALAARLGTPSFAPHVTVDGGLSGPPEDLVARLSDIASTLRAPRLLPGDLTTAPAWNRTLVVELDPTDDVLDARLDICLALDRTVQRSTFRPHLSLVYGPLSDGTRARLNDVLTMRLPPFSPTALALVDTSGPVPGWWELHRWPIAAG